MTKPFNPELKSFEDPNKGKAETVNLKSFFYWLNPFEILNAIITTKRWIFLYHFLNFQHE